MPPTRQWALNTTRQRLGSNPHRIITVQGETRDVVIIGERLHDDDTGEVIGTQGFYLDVTPTNEERQAASAKP